MTTIDAFVIAGLIAVIVISVMVFVSVLAEGLWWRK